MSLNNLNSKKDRLNKPGVSVITCTNRPNYFEQIFNNYTSQNYDKKELIIVLNNNDLNMKKYQEKAKQDKNIKIYQLDEKISLGDCKNFALKHFNLDYVSFFDDDDYYAPNFLNFTLQTFNNTRADIVGKAAFYIYFEKRKILGLIGSNKENCYVDHVADSSMVIKRNVVENIKYPNKHVVQDLLFQNMCLDKGYNIYSTDRYNYVVHRHPNPNIQHDWKISENNLMKQSKIIAKNITDYTNYVIINNKKLHTKKPAENSGWGEIIIS